MVGMTLWERPEWLGMGDLSDREGGEMDCMDEGNDLGGDLDCQDEWNDEWKDA